MKEKIKWFKLYVGQLVEVSYPEVDEDYKEHKYLLGVIPSVEMPLILEMRNSNITFHSNGNDEKLILKELNAITEEDLKECSKLGGLTIQWDLMYIYLRRLIFEDVNNFNYKLTNDITDFLRSKGYAIGIPKEYYVTK